MPILGVVLTHPAPATLADAVAALPGFAALGTPAGSRLPTVFHTARKGDDEPLFDSLRALDGVLAVDLAFADFSDLTATDAEVAR